MSRWLGLVFVVFIIVFAFFNSGVSNAYLPLEYLILPVVTIGVVIGALVSVFGYSGLFKPKDDKRQRLFFEVAKTSTVLSGIIGSLIYFVLTLGNLSDSSNYKFIMASVFFNLFYTGILYFLFSLLESRQERRESRKSETYLSFLVLEYFGVIALLFIFFNDYTN